MTPPKPSDAEAAALLFRHTTAATLRAMTGVAETELDTVYGPVPSSLQSGAQRVLRQGRKKTARLPMPAANLTRDARGEVRGAADAAALHVMHHNLNRHKELSPPDAQAKLVFDLLEQVRCDMLGAQDQVGVAQNLTAALEAQCKRKNYGNPEKPAQAPIEDGLYALCYEALANQPLGPAAKAAADAWRGWVDLRAGDTGLQNLGKHLHDQAEFAKYAYQLIRKLEIDPGRSDPQTDDTGESDTASMGGADSERQEKGTAEAETTEASGSEDAGDMGETEAGKADAESESSAAEDADAGDAEAANEQAGSPRTGNNVAGPIDRAHTYRIFTTKFDEEIEAASLATADELLRLRGLLDQQIKPLQAMIARLANRLQRRLMARQQRHWQFDVDDGILDPARLARVISTPGSPLSFKLEKETDFRDTIVTLLIDNSGSMRGRPITIAALSTDILAKTLERCGVKVEILGFTTTAWKGGKSREAWVSQNRPPQPGRLNDIRHIIYKAADAPWRRARQHIGLMLKEGLLKENIDGEALMWAHQRLMRRPEQRKILMVISDGAPVDDATLSANDSNFLEQDLRRVIDWVEARGAIELSAIGIGHDVTRYYKRAVTLRDVDDLGRTMTHELADLFEIRT